MRTVVVVINKKAGIEHYAQAERPTPDSDLSIVEPFSEHIIERKDLVCCRSSEHHAASHRKGDVGRTGGTLQRSAETDIPTVAVTADCSAGTVNLQRLG